MFGKEHDLISVDVLRGHMDPFYNECRAYGRLVDAGLNGKVAVRCHGYLTIPAEREEELRKNFNVEGWNRPGSEYLKPASRRQPFRAIVKDLISEDVPLTTKSVKKILRDLKRMRKLGVYPMDVRARNYKGGLLVDFSVAITEPHYLFVIKPRWRIEEYKLDDLEAFDRMVRDEGVVTWERAVPEPEYCQKLRSHDSKMA